MCGSARRTVSPLSSSTKRSTPCAAGCCGPKLSVKFLIFISSASTRSRCIDAPLSRFAIAEIDGVSAVSVESDRRSNCAAAGRSPAAARRRSAAGMSWHGDRERRARRAARVACVASGRGLNSAEARRHGTSARTVPHRASRALLLL